MLGHKRINFFAHKRENWRKVCNKKLALRLDDERIVAFTKFFLNAFTPTEVVAMCIHGCAIVKLEYYKLGEKNRSYFSALYYCNVGGNEVGCKLFLSPYMTLHV